MKKLKNLSFLLLAIAIFMPIVVKAQGEGLVNKPDYTQRFVVSSCRALSNAEQNSRNITRLYNIVNQLNRQITNLEAVKARQEAAETDTTRTQNLLNTRMAQRDELNSFIVSLKAEEVPVFCHEMFQKQNQAEILKNERALMRETNRVKSLQARQNTYNARMEISLSRVEEQINNLTVQMDETVDARRQAAQEKRLLALQKRKENSQSQVATYNARVTAQVEQALAKVEEFQGVVNGLKAQNEAMRSGNGMPALHGMTGQEFGVAVNTLANSAPGAVANHVSGQTVPAQPEQPLMMANSMTNGDMSVAGTPATHVKTGQEFGSAASNLAQNAPNAVANHVSGQTVPTQPEQPDRPTLPVSPDKPEQPDRPTLPISPNKPVK